ncbi:nonsense-mediated mRNA decay factor SMG5-like [Haliotis rufescens]|uniref:nonsense-mediated mRNA decay factor SMG5-like n=1 Tax=Haliotis rufescens TaxID=6454 RepID=UPI001EB0185B|nr:nonsense-mediated mRNA decay factor SMG5-like [Haliotis rufescens]
MKKASSTSNEAKPDVDKAKKIYRAALDAIRRLDEISKQKKAYRDVFLQDAVGLRNKLKEYCERLMFYNPSDYGRKAEEVLWRKVFYDIIQVVKHNRKHVRPHGSLETAYRTHLASATGYYQHLLFRLQQEFGLKLSGILDFHLVADPKPVKKHSSSSSSSSSSSKKTPQSVIEWAQRACHRCLICLGDIARYQQDFDHGVSGATAERYYYQAIMLFPDIGMPHNQLGTLSASRYYSCEAAYHYIRCMSTEKSFEGAHGNLQRLFEKNHKRYLELGQIQQQHRDLTPDKQQPQNIRQFFVRFLYLLDVLYDTEKSNDTTLMQSACQATLHDFNLCMFYEPSSMAENYAKADPAIDDPHYLDDDIVFKIVIMCLSTIHLLQRKCSPQLTAAIAFLLALFSHILNHVTNRLQGALYEKEHPNKLLESHKSIAALPHDDHNYSSTSDTERDEMSSHDADHRNNSVDKSNMLTQDEGNKPKKQKQSRLRNLRRRRRRHHSDSSDMSDLSEDSDLSEGGEHIEEDIVSEDSDDDLVTYFDNDSDSDLSDSLMESQELKTGFASSHGNNQSKLRLSSGSSVKMAQENGNWSDLMGNQNLVTLSSELFSSSMTFLGQDLNLDLLNTKQYQADIAAYENCKDVIQGKKDVPVPPGFLSSMEAHHVADITNKLVNFQIETDTEVSACPTDTDPSGLTETEMEADDDNSCDSYNDKAEAERLRLQRVIEVIQTEGLLSTVKVMCDWMQCHSTIINTCAQSSQSLWCRLSVLLNFLPQEKELISHDQIWSDELRMRLTDSSTPSWFQLFPLREDINLSGFSALADIQATIDFTSKHRGQLSEIQETFLRITCLRHFGHFLSQSDCVEFTYNLEQAMFFGPSHTDPEVSEKAAQEKMRDAESRRNQLMRDMAQLRLQAEVSQLEGSLQESEQPMFPPYLITDTSALCSSLPLVKQLILSARGIMVIPLSVIDSLDFMKKESSGAREAIRWLENEFRKGNRYIRAQKSNETLPGNNQRMLKKRNRDQWCLSEILSCSRYLAQQSGNFSSGSVVAILTDHKLDTEQTLPAIRHTITASRQEGVSIENIADFASRWKEVCKSKG